MEIKIVYYNVLSPYTDGVPKYTEEIISISDNTTLKSLFVASQKGTADVSKYYKISKNYYYNHNKLPYIKKINGEIVWEPTYKEIRVIDFIYTHDINDNIIYADIGIPQAGGPDLKNFIHLWNEYYPIIEQISAIFGFCAGITEIGKKIKSLFINEKKVLPPPHGILDLILSKNMWNHYELSVYLDVDKENAKMFLKALGYKWDNNKKLYILQGDVNDIIKKFSNVSFWKHG